MLLYMSNYLTSTKSYINRQLATQLLKAMRTLALALVSIVLVDSAAAAGQRVAAARTPGRSVTPRGPLLATERAMIDLFEKARASATYISTQSRVVDAWTRNVFSVPRGTGSGFVRDAGGHVVTNDHVLAGASSARVRFSDGRDVAALLVGVSRAHDLAVLKVTLDRMPPPLPLGASHDLRVGQTTFAIGNPFGLDFTLTSGIVSALDRALPAEDGRSLVEHLIQTDAAINPDNSGGPLLDSAGRLIGVNPAIFSPSGASSGVGFAIPADTVNRVVPQLIARGRTIRAGLGVQLDDQLNQQITRRLE
jgi:S1-C subfamily serine protease